jgi:hypothetical protein
MRVTGNETALSTSVTGFKENGAVYVFNTGTAGVVTVRNAADDGDVGTIRVGGSASIIITLGAGEGLRGATTIKGTPIVASGY